MIRKYFTLLAAILLAGTWKGAAQTGLSVGSGSTLYVTGGSTLSIRNGSVQNNGTLNVASGTLALSGSSDVQFSGTGTTNLDTLTLGLDAGKLLTLQQNLSIGGQLRFGGGLLNLGNQWVNLGSTGALSGESESSRAYTAASGYLQVSATLNAPSGVTPGNLGLSITSGSNLGSTILRRSYGAQTANGSSSILRQYEMVPANNSNLGATVTFSYFDAELNGNSESTLSLWKYGTQWTDQGGSNASTANNVLSSGVTQNTVGRYTLATRLTGLATQALTVIDSALCSGSATSAHFSGGPAGGTLTYRLGSGSDQTVLLDENGSATFSTGVLTASTTVYVTAVSTTGYTQALNLQQSVTVHHPQVTAPANVSVCNGATAAALAFSGSDATGFTWTNSQPSIGLLASGSGNLPSFTASNSGQSALSATVQVTPLYQIGSLSCTGTAQQFTVTVQPSFSATIVYGGSPYCSSTGTALPTVSGNPNGSFTASPAGLSLDAGTGAIDLAASAAGTYTVSYSYNGGGNCSQSAATTQVTIRPATLVDAVANQSVCGGSATSAVTFTGAAGLSFTWSNSNTGTGLPAAGTGNLPSFTTQNSSGNEVYATITVAATGGTGCANEKAMSFRITVRPQPTVTAVANQTVCAGTATPAVTFSGNVAGATYSWTNSNTAIGLNASGTGNIGSFTALNNSTSAAAVATISVTPSAGGCTGSSSSFTITVSKAAAALSYASSSYCPSGYAPAQLTGTSGGTYTASPAGLTIGSSTGQINLALSATGTYTVSYSLAASGSSCGASVSTTVTILPQATVNTLPNQVYCNNTVAPATVFSGTATSYSWINDNSSIGLAASGTGNLPSFTTVNPGPAAKYAYIKVTPIGNNTSTCTGKAASFRITVNYCGGIAQSGGTGGESGTLRNALRLGPNPTLGDARLYYDGSAKELSVEIQDALGAPQVKAQRLGSGNLLLPSGALRPGTYLVLVTDPASGERASLLLVKL